MDNTSTYCVIIKFYFNIEYLWQYTSNFNDFVLIFQHLKRSIRISFHVHHLIYITWFRVSHCHRDYSYKWLFKPSIFSVISIQSKFQYGFMIYRSYESKTKKATSIYNDCIQLAYFNWLNIIAKLKSYPDRISFFWSQSKFQILCCSKIRKSFKFKV